MLLYINKNIFDKDVDVGEVGRYTKPADWPVCDHFKGV